MSSSSESSNHSSYHEDSEEDSESSMPGPYSFEPSESDSTSSSGSSISSDGDSDRLTDLSWYDKIKVISYNMNWICNRCECSHCDFMGTSAECICCKEISSVVAKIGEANDSDVSCIIEHPGFEAVCLNVWVLQAAYFQYRQHHGTESSPPSLNE